MKTAYMIVAFVLITFCSPLAAEDFERWKQTEQWVLLDTLTDLEWTRRDNLGDVNWNEARQYCRTLEISGSGWRLPSRAELSQVFTGGRDGTTQCGNYECKVSSKFYLTGPRFWTSEREGSSEAWYMNLFYGTRSSGPVSNSVNLRALCVRPRS